MKLKDAIILLEHQVPLPYDNCTVRLTSVLDDDTYGDCSVDVDKRTIKIRLRKQAPLIAQLDALIHEWAHATLVGTLHFGEHDSLWGVSYAKCYRAVYGD